MLKDISKQYRSEKIQSKKAIPVMSGFHLHSLIIMQTIMTVAVDVEAPKMSVTHSIRVNIPYALPKAVLNQKS